jgi:hypothetical protein
VLANDKPDDMKNVEASALKAPSLLRKVTIRTFRSKQVDRAEQIEDGVPQENVGTNKWRFGKAKEEETYQDIFDKLKALIKAVEKTNDYMVYSNFRDGVDNHRTGRVGIARGFTLRAKPAIDSLGKLRSFVGSNRTHVFNDDLQQVFFGIMCQQDESGPLDMDVIFNILHNYQFHQSDYARTLFSHFRKYENKSSVRSSYAYDIALVFAPVLLPWDKEQNKAVRLLEALINDFYRVFSLPTTVSSQTMSVIDAGEEVAEQFQKPEHETNLVSASKDLSASHECKLGTM